MNIPKSWQGSIRIDDSIALSSIVLQCPADSHHVISPKASLRFLSLVETSRIPLHLIIGPSYDVGTNDPATDAWFSRHLLAGHLASPDGPWWQTAKPDSPLGVLVAVDLPHAALKKTDPRITELLFYATRSKLGSDEPPTRPGSEGTQRLHKNALTDTQSISIRAVGLSADLYCPRPEPTPPSSPASAEAEGEAFFLPPCVPQHAEIVNEPPVRKRRTANDAFDEATERRKRARRHGGESVAAAAALKREDSLPSLKHRRSLSGSIGPPAPLPSRAFSRSPSIASSMPGTARAPSEAPRRSSLLHVQNAPDAQGASTETKNKDTISRIVMAGMRLYGLCQSKSKRARPHMTDTTLAADIPNAQREAERQADGEYKLVYHQVYKDTCFAFRRQIAAVSWHAHTEVLRETVDKLLALYCNDPLGAGLPGPREEVTPGGRKAFGSVHKEEEYTQNMFPLPRSGG